MNIDDQVKIIKDVLSNRDYSDYAAFDFEDKCQAIFNWCELNEGNFSIGDVKDIYFASKNYTEPSHWDVRRINSILASNNIFVEEWKWVTKKSWNLQKLRYLT